MLRKEELCTWFSNLSPHKRIDFMCGMLHMCLPLELRFLGSCVEDLAKKDFQHLREYELRANNRRDISELSNETSYDTFRNTLAVYLALLHSANTICSHKIFTMLERHRHCALEVKNGMDSETVHRILLVLSMAMNHPAFTFAQKQTMSDMYITASEAAVKNMSKKMQEPELLILSESCETRPCDQGHSPMCSPMSSGSSPMQMIPSPQPLHSLQEKAYVCNIKVCGSRLRDGVKNMTEYHIQVTWSNGETGEVYKTYQELEEFHNKLLHKKSLKIPKLQGSQNHHRETIEQLNQYFQTLSEQKLSKLQSDMYTKFLLSHGVKTSVDASTSPPRSIQKEPPSAKYLSLSRGEAGSEEPALEFLGSLCNLSSTTPYPHDLNQQAVTISPSYSGLKAPSSLASSPCPSHDSLDSISPPLEAPDSTEMSQLLSGELATYVEHLEKFSFQQVCDMDPEMFQRLGIPSEAAQRIKNLISEKMREMTVPHMPNGLVDQAVLSSSFNCQGRYQMVPLHYPPMFPVPPGHHPIALNSQTMLYHQNMLPLSHMPSGSLLPTNRNTNEASPTNFEHSTPSPSPHVPYSTPSPSPLLSTPLIPPLMSTLTPSPHVPTPLVPPLMLALKQQQLSTDSSSDEDKHSSQQRGKDKANSAPNSARFGLSDINSRTNGNQSLATNGNSGYNSDPTFNGRQRTQLGRLTIPMPDNSLKPQFKFLRPCVMFNPQTHPPMFIPQTCINSSNRPIIPHNLSQCHTTNVVSHSGSVSTATSTVAGPGSVSVSHPINATATNFAASGSAHSTNGVPVQVNLTLNKPFKGSAGIVAPVSVYERSGPVVNGESTPSQTMSSNESPAQWAGGSVAPSVPSSVTLTYSSSSPTLASTRSSCAVSVCQCPSCPSRNGQPSIHYAQPNFHHYQHPQFFQYSHHMPMYPMPYMPVLNHNGFTQDMLSQPMFYSYGAGLAFPGMPGGYNAFSSNGGLVNTADMQRKVKRMNCHNCGSDKHAATDCTESSMQTQLGQSMYSYDPKYEPEKQ
ncbi:zinc finger CCHC domain-containing protein 2-like isoform X2 [Dreissena polymorpha]|nr:zinc finger CCHC domain-containing protein 2-like isoform X2 [Dreissena polymorpha]